MDNDQNVNATGAPGGSIMKSPDMVGSSGSLSDTLTRRMKNRERQRRYRARKRLEADTKRTTSAIDQSSSSPPVELEPNGYLDNCITPLPHKRNWKRDARRAHDAPGNTVSSITASNIESEALCLAAGIVTEPDFKRELQPEDSLSLAETCKMDQGRRDWKAEARNKMK